MEDVFGSFLFESQGLTSPSSYFSSNNIDNGPRLLSIHHMSGIVPSPFPASSHFTLTAALQMRNCGSKQVSHLPSRTDLLSSRARIWTQIADPLICPLDLYLCVHGTFAITLCYREIKWAKYFPLP